MSILVPSMQSNESSGRKAPPVFAAFWQECSRPASILKTTVEEWARTLCPDVPVLSRHSPSCVRTFPAPYETSRFCVGLPGPVRTFSISGRTFLTSCEPSPLHPSQALLIPCEPPPIPGGPSPPWPSRVTFLSRRAHEGHGNVRMLEVLTFLSGHLPSGHTSAGTLRGMTIFVTSGVDWAGGSPGGADMAEARVELAWPGPGGVGVVETRRDSGQGSVARSR